MTLAAGAAASLPRVSVARRAGGGPLRILILGGTGFVGPAMAHAALARGHKVTLFNRGRTEERRKETGRPLDFMDEVEVLYGNRDPEKTADDWKKPEDRDPASPKGLSQLGGKQWDAVFDTSGYVPRIVGASARLLAPNVKHYTFISSVSVYRSSAEPYADETAEVGTMPDPKVEDMGAGYENYGPLKALSERAAEDAMPGRVAKVRPGLIVGPGDTTRRFTYWPVRVARGGEVLSPGTPNDPVQLIDVRDLSEFCVHLAEARIAGTFDAVGPPPAPGTRLTIGDVLAACKEVSGSDATFTWVPAAFLAQHNVTPWGDMPLWVPPEGDSAGFHTRKVERAVKAGLTFRPIEETCKATLDWYNSRPEEAKPQLTGPLKPEREAEVLAAWHAEHPG
ncbi:MAG: NAD-dependent epimerase/dehydratase family protein [Phycisphaerales bacterium]|nr:NAD-dependent epimerase/dehydratase family protein [Phycisphaerales bacterium]